MGQQQQILQNLLDGTEINQDLKNEIELLFRSDYKIMLFLGLMWIFLGLSITFIFSSALKTIYAESHLSLGVIGLIKLILGPVFISIYYRAKKQRELISKLILTLNHKKPT